jgi:hypothetical protein
MHEHPLPMSVPDGQPSTDRAWLETEFVREATMREAALAAAAKAAADANVRYRDRSLVWGILLFAAAWVALCIMWVL